MSNDIQSGSISSRRGGKVWVDFPRAFDSKPEVSISVSGFAVDLTPSDSFDLAVTVDDVSIKGFNAVFHLSGRVRSVSAAWLAYHYTK